MQYLPSGTQVYGKAGFCLGTGLTASHVPCLVCAFAVMSVIQLRTISSGDAESGEDIRGGS